MHLLNRLAVAATSVVAIAGVASAQVEPPLHQAILDGDVDAIWANLDDPDVPGVSPPGIRPLLRLLTPEADEVLDTRSHFELLEKLLGPDGANLSLPGYVGYEGALYAFGPLTVIDPVLTELSNEGFDASEAGADWEMPYYPVSQAFDPYWYSDDTIECTPMGFALLGAMVTDEGSSAQFEAANKLFYVFLYFDGDTLQLDEVCRFLKVPAGLDIADSKISVHDWLAYAGGIYGNEVGLESAKAALMDQGLYDEAEYEASFAKFEPLAEGLESKRQSRMAQQTISRPPQTEKQQVVSAPPVTAVSSSRGTTIDPEILQPFRNTIERDFTTELKPTLKPDSKEPAIHKAIMRGDLNAFRRALDDPKSDGYSPRGLPPMARLMTKGVQESVPADVRMQMIRDLSEAGGGPTGLPSAYLNGPPELVRELIIESVERMPESYTPDRLESTPINILFPVVDDFSTPMTYGQSLYDSWVSIVRCTPAGMISWSVASREFGTPASQESLENLMALLEIVPTDILRNQPACYFSKGKVDSLEHRDLSMFELMLLIGVLSESEQNAQAGINILQAAGLWSEEAQTYAESWINPVLGEIRGQRQYAYDKRQLEKQLDSLPIDRREPAIHKALLRGDYDGVIANLSQANSTGVSPSGIRPYLRLITPRVQNQFSASEQMSLGTAIAERIDVTDFDNYQVLVHAAAYGAFDYFKILLDAFHTGRESVGKPRISRDQLNLTSVQRGQGEYSQFGSTHDTCPVLMHVWYSYISAPNASTQLEEAKSKLIFLLSGIRSWLDDGPDLDSPILGDPEQSCIFYQLKSNPMAPGGIERRVRSRPNLYTELEKALKMPAQKERAEWVVDKLIEYGRFKPEALSYWADIDAQRQRNLAARNREEAETLAATRAYERQMDQQSLSAGIAGGLSAIDRDLRSTPEAQRAELERRAGEEAERLSRERLRRGEAGTGLIVEKDGEYVIDNSMFTLKAGTIEESDETFAQGETSNGSTRKADYGSSGVCEGFNAAEYESQVGRTCALMNPCHPGHDAYMASLPSEGSGPAAICN
ncbi:MAG: hypothetical protein CMK07_09595 [Ponticaulis sp.]|nr:hypothetical protein [Ponticaulis sp.]